MLTNGALTLTAFSDTPFSVVANPDVTEISNQWIYLGPATAIGPGVYEFIDTNLTYNRYRFYRHALAVEVMSGMVSGAIVHRTVRFVSPANAS